MKTNPFLTTALVACLSCFTFSTPAAPTDTTPEASRPGPSSPPAAKPGTIWQTKGDGRSAEAQFSDALGGGRINLFQNGGSTFLFYEIWGNDPTSINCTQFVDDFGIVITVCVFTRFNYDYGWGEIPGTDLQFTATNAILVTTTGTNFSSTRCTTDSSTTNVVTTCTNGTPVTFNLVWEPNNFSTHSIKGESQHAFATFAFTSKGSSVARSAYVSGRVNGRALANAPGRLGETKGRNVATVIVP